MTPPLKDNGHVQAIHFDRPPRRIVSLVPSVTESLFELGAGERVVGITDFCVHPASKVAALPRVGGPRNPDIARISALAPDLVIANQEENTRETVENLGVRGIRVWVTFPTTVRDAIDLLWALIRLCDIPQAQPRLELLERSSAWTLTASAALSPVRVFVPVWRDAANPPTWWMTANRETYLHDLLALCGGANVFADRVRHFPLSADLGHAEPRPRPERDTRYPRVTPDEIVSRTPDVILLPDEPYRFAETDRELVLSTLSATPAARHGRVYLCDGSLLTWHGTRLARALADLPALLHPPSSPGQPGG